MSRLVDPATRTAATPRVARLIALSALALAGFFAVYLLAVHTEVGQRGDEAALAGVEQVPERAQSAANRMLRTVSIGSLLIATGVLTGIALLRRRPALLLLPAAIIGISLIATEVFKLWLLERPDLVVDSRIAENSYPSGHTTVFASIGLAFLVVAPPRLRPWAALLAAGLAAASGVFTVTADWHRPSDAVGSYLLTLGSPRARRVRLSGLAARRQSPARSRSREPPPPSRCSWGRSCSRRCATGRRWTGTGFTPPSCSPRRRLSPPPVWPSGRCCARSTRGRANSDSVSRPDPGNAPTERDR